MKTFYVIFILCITLMGCHDKHNVPEGTTQIIINYHTHSDTITLKLGKSMGEDIPDSHQNLLQSAIEFYEHGDPFTDVYLISHSNYKKQVVRVDSVIIHSAKKIYSINNLFKNGKYEK